MTDDRLFQCRTCGVILVDLRRRDKYDEARGREGEVFGWCVSCRGEEPGEEPAGGKATDG